MLTSLHIKNFKQFDDVKIELGDRVVFIGPNNSGKTSALQALALWHLGLTQWFKKNAGKSLQRRTGVPLNRKDLISIPLPETAFLWKEKRLRRSATKEGKSATQNIRIEIAIEGLHQGRIWNIRLAFDYANKESLYCRPVGDEPDPAIAEQIIRTPFAFLPPMSGLSAIEPKLEIGRVNVLLGEGQTAQVLRNLCYRVFENSVENWDKLNHHLLQLFGAQLEPPDYDPIRGEISMQYRDRDQNLLDLSCTGRGFQQTLLLLSYIYANRGTVLLLDEPDAHLEILRQKEVYRILTEIASENNSQLFIASHSEIILNLAANQDMVVAFVGKPHRIDNRSSQVLKSLKDISFDQYYLAEQTGWILYLEGSTDLHILREFAKILNHDALEVLERPFVHYVANMPNKAEEHFHGISEAKKDLLGIAIYDHSEKKLNDMENFRQVSWKKREIENYFINSDVLMKYVTDGLSNDLFGASESDKRVLAMQNSIGKVTTALQVLGKPEPFSDHIKITDDFLDKVFQHYFEELKQDNLMRKTNYHTLVKYCDAKNLDYEITEKLDMISNVAKGAMPQ